MKIVYQYNIKGYYLGTDFDYGTGLPNNTTYIEPSKVEEGFIQKWNGGTWIEEKTYKGQTVWQDGQEIEWKQHGALPDGVTITKPPEPEPTEKEKAQTRINEINQELIRLDISLSRPLGEIADPTVESSEGLARIQSINIQKATLRAERAELQAIKGNI